MVTPTKKTPGSSPLIQKKVRYEPENMAAKCSRQGPEVKLRQSFEELKKNKTCTINSSFKPNFGFSFTSDRTAHLNYSSYLTQVMCAFKSEKKNESEEK